MTDKDYNDCVDNFADGVYRFIVKNIRHTEDAQDIVQSAFEKLWVNRAQVLPEKAKTSLNTRWWGDVIATTLHAVDLLAAS